MSVEYYTSYPTYCSSCQTLAQYNEDFQVTACSSSEEFINPQLYNQMIKRLKILNQFGENDTVTRQPSNVSVLKDKTTNTLVETDYYNDIGTRISKGTKSQGTVLYGSYFDDLKSAVNNYKIPSTRYWTCVSQGITDCCDCYGECYCYGQCSCYGECSYSPCSCEGECSYTPCCTAECGSYGNCGETSWAENGCSAAIFKENIHNFNENALSLINEIQIVDFNYIDDPNKEYKVGFIADNTNAIFATSQHNKMDYYNCIGMLLKAIQELTQEINELKGKNQ